MMVYLLFCLLSTWKLPYDLCTQRTLSARPEADATVGLPECLVYADDTDFGSSVKEYLARRIQLANASLNKLEKLWKHRSLVAENIRLKAY